MKYFIANTFLLLIVLFFLGCKSSKVQTENKDKIKTKLESEFRDGGRISVLLTTLNNKKVNGYCDTGGGFTAIWEETFNELGLVSPADLEEVDLREFKMKCVPSKKVFSSNVPVPYLHKSMDKLFKKEIGSSVNGIFFLPKKKFMDESEPSTLLTEQYDGFLGQYFFLGKSWTFDYPNEEVWINTPLMISELKNTNVQKIGINKISGKQLHGHPSIKIEIAGKEINALFDTGAIFRLTDAAKDKLNESNSVIAGSFLAATIFEELRETNPDWKFIEEGDYGEDMLQIPEVKIGNYKVGPCWFSKTDDNGGEGWMGGTMDKSAHAAIGGTVLKYFCVTIDYNNELIKFSRKEN